MLGSNILAAAKRSQLDVLHPSRVELDLMDKDQIQKFFNKKKISTIIHCAAKVGGISANIEKPADFILENLLIDSNLLSVAREANIKNLIYFGSSCMYPRDFRQPLKEIDILGGPLEPTNESYALSKISAARVVTATAIQEGLSWRVLIPSNLYGPGDNFNPSTSHLVASIIFKAKESLDNNSKELEIWGDGHARREFTYVGDVADFVVSNLNNISEWDPVMNIGIGLDYSIREYYEKVCKILHLTISFKYNLDKPVGMKQKLMDSAIANRHGWSPTTTLDEGLVQTILWLNQGGLNER